METYSQLAHEIPLKHVDFTVWKITKDKRQEYEKRIRKAYNERARLRHQTH